MGIWKKTKSFFRKTSIKTTQVAKSVASNSMSIYGNMYRRYKHIIHTGEGMTHGPSHLAQWIPYFSRSEENFLILVRNIDLFNWVRDNYSYLTVVYAKGAVDVDNILKKLGFVRAIYYLSNTGNLIHTLRYNVYKHIFLGHGDSEKAASAHKFFRVYDEIWVAGQAHIDRFKNADFDASHIKFIKIGRPMSKHVVKGALNYQQVPRILYLPTWEGVYEENNYSSLRLSATMLQALSTTFNLPMEIKFHPVSGSRDKMLSNVSKDVTELLSEVNANFFIADKLTPVDKLISSNSIYICDISAVVSECLATACPLFVYIPVDKEIITSQSDMPYDEYAYTFSNIEELCQQMQALLSGQDPKKEQRLRARDYFISVEQTQNDEFTRQLKLIDENNSLVDNFREIVVQ